MIATTVTREHSILSLFTKTFRRLLIAKLQDEFENRNKKLEAFDSKVGPLDSDEEEQRMLSKHHMLGNIKFIGESPDFGSYF